MYIKKEHYSNFGTFEIASLVNVPRHYLRKYGIFKKTSLVFQYDLSGLASIRAYIEFGSKSKVCESLNKLDHRKWIKDGIKKLGKSRKWPK